MFINFVAAVFSFVCVGVHLSNGEGAWAGGMFVLGAINVVLFFAARYRA